ncbi:unnamed protein product, partial [Closterium sp. NIES-54]
PAVAPPSVTSYAVTARPCTHAALLRHAASCQAAPPSRAAPPTDPRRSAEPRRPTEPHCPACPTASAAPAATAPTSAMASPTVLTFDAEGRAVNFDVWVDDLQLFLQCDSRDGVSFFDHTSGVFTTPTATADSTVHSLLTTRDAVARLAVRSHLPPTERVHFGQYKTAQSLYDTVVAHYSSPATTALSRLMLPYLFPDLATFATVTDLIAHLRTTDARYRAALPNEDHFLSLCPTELSVNLLKERLTAAEKTILAVGASRGDRCTPFFEGRSELRLSLVGGAATARARGARVVEGTAGAAAEAVEVAEGVAVEVGVVPGVGASVAAVEVVEAAAAVVEVVAAAVVLVEVQPRSVEALVVASASSSRVPVRPRRPSSFVSGTQGMGGQGSPPLEFFFLPAPSDAPLLTRPCWPLLTRPLHCPTASATTVATAATAATLATAPNAAKASPTALTFDAEERAVYFDVKVDDLQLFLQCNSRDGVSLFYHTSGVSTAPSATADSTVRSQWTTHDAVARLAVRIARYSSPATAALSRPMLPYLFPDLAAFATVVDLVAHLRTSDARYRTALPAEFYAKNPPPMYITLYYLVTRLPDSLSSVRDHFLSLCPTELTVDLQEERLAAAEKIILVLRLPLMGDAATARARGARVVEGAAGEAVEEVEEAEEVAMEVGVVSGVGAPVAAVEVVAAVAEVVEEAAAVVEVEAAVVLVEVQPRSMEALVAASASSSCAPVRHRWSCNFLPRWHYLLLQNVPIFDLDFDAILAAMYAFADSAEGDCYLSVPPDPGIAAAALGASASAAPGTGASAAPGAGASTLFGTAPTEALHTFTLDSGASHSFFRDSTTQTPLNRPVAVSLADPSRGLVLAHSSTVLPCPVAPSGLLSGLHLPSFSTNLVSGADLQDAWVDQFTPGGQRVTHCTCSRTGRHLATFTRRPGSSLYALTTAPPPVSASGQVAASSQVFAAASRSSLASAPCSCRPLSHETLLWHHRLGHPSLPRLRGMASCALVLGLPRSHPSLPPGPASTCVPCVEGRQRAAPHSSSFPLTEAPLQTVHMDVWGPARVLDRVTSVTSCCLLMTTRVTPQSSPCASRVRSLRGGEFSSNLLRAFCRSEGIRQTFTLSASPQQNGIAERCIGVVMDVARTSLIHAAAPHFLWPFAVQYAGHQINLQPRVSLPETTPTLGWTGKVGDASAFRVWGSRAFVRDTTADKLSSRAVPCVFLGFPPDAPGWQFYHPTSRRVLSSQDVTFDESGPSPSGVSQVDLAEPVEVAVDSGAARGAEPAGAGTGGAEPRVSVSGGVESGRVEPEGTA